jgi:hypothetical protein
MDLARSCRSGERSFVVVVEQGSDWVAERTPTSNPQPTGEQTMRFMMIMIPNIPSITTRS